MKTTPASRACSAALLAAALLHVPAMAADKTAWDVSAEHGKTKTVRFTTDEGTWLDLDVSPDGSRIVFSMMGDIYLLPIAGGQARRISSGPAWDVQPRFSPDGREIAFTSDRGGGNNLWRMGSDGSNAVQVTKESFRLFNNPVWTPDGQFLIGRKHFTSERSLGAGELWMIHRDGGSGLQLTKRRNDQMDLGEPAVSPDGRYVYYSEDISPGSVFEYNKNVHGVIYAIKRLDRQTGETEVLVNTPGGAIRPQPSPDGKRLAFIKRVRDKTVLHVLDLSSGKVTPVWDGLSHDMQEVWAIFGPYANFNWTPDSKAVVIWAKGKLWRVDMQNGRPSEIAFNAEVEQKLTAPIRVAHQLDGSSFNPKLLRDVATSPDGNTVVFHAVGRLWKRQLPDGQITALTAGEGLFEYQPSFSRDGRKLLYTTWSDKDQGSILELDLASGAVKTLTREPGFYYQPRYSPDGRQMVFIKAGGDELTGNLNSVNRGIFITATDNWSPLKIADGYEPQFLPDSKQLVYMSGGGLSKTLNRIGLHGENPRELMNLKYADSVQISPDGKHVAFTELYNAYVAPLPAFNGSIELSKDSTAVPVTRLTETAGPYLHWSDADTVHWMLGNRYFSRDLKAAANTSVSMAFSVPSDRPQDLVAFTGARVITMRDAENRQEIIENGTVVVKGDRILAVGAGIPVPAGARVIDATGKTLFPGIVDVHAHAVHFNTGVSPQANWAYYANLAFGITTMHDPSATSETVFSQAELQQAGLIVGPRVLSTGTILYGAEGDFKTVINSLEDARSAVTRMKAIGAISVKSYNQPRREQRQQINQAAREQGVLVVEEGGATFNHNMTMILDGVTGVEHNITLAPLYRDVVDVWKATDVRNTPTLVVNYGGLNGEYWWYSRMNIWENERFLRFYPQDALDARSIRRETAPEWDYYHFEVARQAKRLRDAGIRIQVGGHGQMQGLSPNWEIWSLVQGGFTPWQALRAATIDGADYLGYSSEFGSIEAGKRADLVITNGNPLDNIENTIDTAYVMANGRLFDAATMAEIGGKGRAAPAFDFNQQQSGLSVGQESGPSMHAEQD